MHPKDWITIPTLPCVALDETIAFWETLGFERTYYQNKPYQYGVVARNGYELHFSRIKGLTAQTSYSGCLIMVADVAAVHQEFVQRLRAHFGKVPGSGFPRISRFRPGQTRFTVTDPSGNSVIVIQFGEADSEVYNGVNASDLTRLQVAIVNAVRFCDFKTDEAAAAKVLDVALKRMDGEAQTDIALALLMRLELAEQAHDTECIQLCKAALKQIRLASSEIAAVQARLNSMEAITDCFVSSEKPFLTSK